MKTSSRVLLLAAAAIVWSSCSSDAPSAPPAANITLTPNASSVTASDPIALRLGGSTVDSLGAVTVGGAPISAGLDGDSVVRMLMPLGASGPVTITVNAWSGRVAVTASSVVQRVAAVSVGDETVFVTTVLTGIDARLDAAAAAPVPAGVDAVDFAADIATLRYLRDSLEARIAGLDPASRTLVLTMIAESNARASEAESLALMDNVEAADCTGWRLSVACVLRARDRLTRANASTQARLAYTVAVTAVSAAAFVSGAPVIATITGLVALYNYTVAGSDFAEYTVKGVEEVTAPAVRWFAELSDDTDLRAGLQMRSFSAVALPTFRPDEPVTLPLVRQSRSALPTDTLVPLVAPLPSLIAGVRDYWDELMDLLPTELRVRPPGLPATPTRIRRERAEPGEVSVVSVRAGTAPAAGITATISDDAGNVRLTLSGDPGEGQDLTVRLALDGDGAGRVEFDVALRYESAPACPATMFDNDGNEYPVVQIGAYCWQAANMRATSGGNGVGIPAVTNSAQFMGWLAPDLKAFPTRTTPAYTWYEHNAAYDAVYGKMYNHFAAVQVCPVGWRVPSGEEFYFASAAAVGPNNPQTRMGGALKATGTSLWVPPNLATNSTGFSALPGGIFVPGESNNFVFLGEATAYWLAERYEGQSYDVASSEGVFPYTELLGNNFALFSGSEGTGGIGLNWAQGGAYVRCITDINQ